MALYTRTEPIYVERDGSAGDPVTIGTLADAIVAEGGIPAASIADFDTAAATALADALTAKADLVAGVVPLGQLPALFDGTNAMGCVAHGATAGTARPSGYAVVVWVGSVDPANKSTGDLWVRT